MAEHKEYLEGCDPQDFVDELESLIKGLNEGIEEEKKKLFSLKMQRVNSKDLKGLDKLETDIFWCENRIKGDSKEITIINNVLNKLGWRIGYKNKWKKK